MVLIYLLAIAIGFAFLILSSEQAIKRLVKLAQHFNVTEFSISFLVVGIVAIFPELSIGINSALAGESSFGLGIVLGSNVADLTLIVGAIALAANGIKLHDGTLRNMKYFIFPLALPIALLLDGSLSRFDGLMLVAAFTAYVAVLLSQRPAHPAKEKKPKRDGKYIAKEAAILAISLAVLLASGRIITDAAHQLSLELALPLMFIGMLLAIGTCLPELTFAFRASQQHHGELGLGNIFGNVLADCMLSLGIIALISPIKPQYPQLAIGSGIASIIAVILMLWLLGRRWEKNTLSKKDGIILMVYYAAFLALQTLLEKTLIG